MDAEGSYLMKELFRFVVRIRVKLYQFFEGVLLGGWYFS
jgi:hypothetical protein